VRRRRKWIRTKIIKNYGTSFEEQGSLLKVGIKQKDASHQKRRNRRHLNKSKPYPLIVNTEGKIFLALLANSVINYMLTNEYTEIEVPVSTYHAVSTKIIGEAKQIKGQVTI
jgi:hypothetical protein